MSGTIQTQAALLALSLSPTIIKQVGGLTKSELDSWRKAKQLKDSGDWRGALREVSRRGLKGRLNEIVMRIQSLNPLILEHIGAALALPNASESERLLIMGDKAEDLGFVWDRAKYPTPAWDFDIKNLRYNKGPVWLSENTWNKELRLWSADCAERALPIWEEWAESQHLDDAVRAAPRRAIEAARLLAVGKITKEAAYAAAYAAYAAAYAAADAAADAAAAAYAAAYAAAAYAASRSKRLEEEKWQHAALARRLDALAPWRIE